MQFIAYIFTRFFVELFRFVPFGLLYVISDGVAWLFYKIGYRSEVVYGNLRRCFPEKSAKEIDDIARASYRNLADVTLESIKGTTAPLDEIRKRYTVKDAEVMNRHLRDGRSLILTGGHYCNWEWAVITIAGSFQGNTIGVYKPLTNPFVNKWMFKTRSRDGKMILKSMKETFGAVEAYKKSPTVFILVGDQSPSNRKTAQWIEFFGQETACAPGVDVIARANDFMVYFFEIKRLKRGHYEFSFKEVELHPTSTQVGDITKKYMGILESIVKKEPGDWLWSHRRWKMKKEG